jgi:hypothetical protein
MNEDYEHGKSEEFFINNQYNEQLPMFIKQKEGGNLGKKEKKKGKRHRRQNTHHHYHIDVNFKQVNNILVNYGHSSNHKEQEYKHSNSISINEHNRNQK